MAADTKELVERYRRDGYLMLKNFFPAGMVADLQRATAETTRLAVAGEGPQDLLDVVPDGEGVSRLRRVVDPEKVAPEFDRAMRHGPLVDLLSHLLGGTVRFDHGKMNFKPPKAEGSTVGAVEWHQDWSFYPQTNDDMLAVGIMVEDCTEENGPLMVVPGSHKGPVYDHHHNGEFVGAAQVKDIEPLLSQAVAVTGPAGSISIHHVRTLHGSASNHGKNDRPLLLFNYAAADAFPIFHRYDWDAFNARLLRGEPTQVPRLEPVPVRVPEPVAKTDDGYTTPSLFELQGKMGDTLYGRGQGAPKASQAQA